MVHTHQKTWRWYSNNAPWCGWGKDGLEINTTEGAQVRFSDTRSSTTITDVYADFWFTRAGLVWTAAKGDSGCWTVPTATGATTRRPGSHSPHAADCSTLLLGTVRGRGSRPGTAAMSVGPTRRRVGA